MLGGLHKSQNILLALIQKGLSRNEAYKIVQSIAMKSWKTKESFEKLLQNNRKIREYLNPKELNDILGKEDKIRNLDYIFKKII